jgi:hypothetical protein
MSVHSYRKEEERKTRKNTLKIAIITAANGYTFESNDIIKPNGERLFQ